MLTELTAWGSVRVRLVGGTAAGAFASLRGEAATGAPDVVVFLGVEALEEGISSVPGWLPVCVVLEDRELALTRRPRTTLSLLRHAARINLLVLRDLSSCSTFAHVPAALPVARYDGDPSQLRYWVTRAHAYGHVLAPRPVAQ